MPKKNYVGYIGPEELSVEAINGLSFHMELVPSKKEQAEIVKELDSLREADGFMMMLDFYMSHISTGLPKNLN